MISLIDCIIADQLPFAVQILDSFLSVMLVWTSTMTSDCICSDQVVPTNKFFEQGHYDDCLDYSLLTISHSPPGFVFRGHTNYHGPVAS